VLKFIGDAIELSGETGTKLKSDILGAYYPLWWYITSGGPHNLHSNPTAFIEMNAGSGENSIKESGSVILGSSGHAINVKSKNPSSPLKVILVEEDAECFSHLKRVVSHRWPSIMWSENVEDPTHDVYLLHSSHNEILQQLEQLDLGQSLFFFDPLLYTPWHEVQTVAKNHIHRYYKTGTEFVLFQFTSDWFLGRGSMSPLPDSLENWTDGEKKTVEQMDNLFGHTFWRNYLLNSKSSDEKMSILVELYKKNLHAWFRYVLPFPFKPKSDQLYHLFVCSNYEGGIAIAKKFYAKNTQNPIYSPDYNTAFLKFRIAHQIPYFKKNTKPLIWKILWRIIKDHEEGICDVNCVDLKKLEYDYSTRKYTLEWLHENNYLEKIHHYVSWTKKPEIYQLNWKTVKTNLKIDPPEILLPLEKILPEPKLKPKPKTLDDFF